MSHRKSSSSPAFINCCEKTSSERRKAQCGDQRCPPAALLPAGSGAARQGASPQTFLSSGRVLSCLPETLQHHFRIYFSVRAAALTPAHPLRAGAKRLSPLFLLFGVTSAIGNSIWTSCSINWLLQGKEKRRFLRFMGLEISEKYGAQPGTIPQKHRTAGRKHCCRDTTKCVFALRRQHSVPAEAIQGYLHLNKTETFFQKGS